LPLVATREMIGAPPWHATPRSSETRPHAGCRAVPRDRPALGNPGPVAFL